MLGKLPVETMVLPAHNQPYTGLHTRCQELKSHHENLLAELLSYCIKPRLLVECLAILYKRPLTGQLLFFALAEALAHVNYLIKAGLVTRSLDTQNRYSYQTRKTG